MDAPFEQDDSPCRTPSERKSLRRYVVEFVIAMGLYVILLIVSRLAEHRSSTGSAAFAIALLPEIGVIAVTVAIVRFAMRMDEMQRRIAIDATACAGVVTVVACMGLGFLENAGVPRISPIWTFPLAMAAWGIALPVMHRLRT